MQEFARCFISGDRTADAARKRSRSAIVNPNMLSAPMRRQIIDIPCSLAYSLATAIFGGFTPAIATWLIHATGNKAMPGVWVSFAALCGLVATLAIVKPAGKHVHGAGTVPAA